MPNMLYHYHNVEKDDVKKQESDNAVAEKVEQKQAPKKRAKKPAEGK